MTMFCETSEESVSSGRIQGYQGQAIKSVPEQDPGIHKFLSGSASLMLPRLGTTTIFRYCQNHHNYLTQIFDQMGGLNGVLINPPGSLPLWPDNRGLESCTLSYDTLRRRAAWL